MNRRSALKAFAALVAAPLVTTEAAKAQVVRPQAARPDKWTTVLDEAHVHQVGGVYRYRITFLDAHGNEIPMQSEQVHLG